MATIVKVDGDRVVQALEEARAKLANGDAEVVLDFAAVDRIDAGALRGLENLSITLNGNGPKVVISHVNIHVYKTLKLMKLTPRFTFRT